MQNQIQMKNTMLWIKNSLPRAAWRGGFALTGLALAILALSPTARATDRGNGNTSDGASALLNLTDGSFNTALGSSALQALTTASDNSATGAFALYSNTTGIDNTADGFAALSDSTTGDQNTATGTEAFALNTTGSFNTANGVSALQSNTTVSFNTASGVEALFSNTTGTQDTATGYESLYSKTTGIDNTATGVFARFDNTTGSYNTAAGVQALYNDTTGNQNTAQGFDALYSNTTGVYNTSAGLESLYSNTTGGNNTAVGLSALFSNTTGSSNIAFGLGAGLNLTTGSNNIDIGNAGVAAESNTIRLGTSGTQTATFVAGIRGVAVAGGQPVAVSASGQLGMRASAARFKENIKPMDKASEAILSLRPVTFRYKKELDPKGAAQFGLVAEQVAKISPDLVVCDDQGKPFTVRYDEVNAMLLNEFIKGHRRVEHLEAAMARQKSEFRSLLVKHQTEQQQAIATLTRALKEQAGQIQKINARLAQVEAAPRLVASTQQAHPEQP